MSRFRTFIRDDEETEIEVEYSISGGSQPSGHNGPPEHYDPGSAMEVEIEDAWLKSDENMKDAPRIELTDDEAERFDREVNEDPETWELDEYE